MICLVYDSADECQCGKRRVMCRRDGCWMNSGRGVWVRSDRAFNPGSCTGAPLADEPRQANVGDRLSQLIGDLGIAKPEGCACEAMVRKMNAWGIDGCKANRAAIVKHLKAAYSGLTWQQVAQAVASGIASGIAMRLNPLDVCGSLVDEAIRLAQPGSTAWAARRDLLAENLQEASDSTRRPG